MTSYQFISSTEERSGSIGPRIVATSFAQKRLWFLDKIMSGVAAYHVPIAFRLIGNVDRTALEKSFNEIIRRHEIFRTTFITDGDEPLQRISSPFQVSIQVEPLKRDCNLHSILTREVQFPFFLDQGPLFRVKLFQFSDSDHVLLIILHHIITDGWSLSILMRELSELYKAFASGEPSPLQDLKFQYSDFAIWQKEQLKGEVLEEHLAFWKKQLGTNHSLLELPADRPRPEIPTYAGKCITHMFSSELLENLIGVARKKQSTLYMVVLAAFYILIYRYTGNREIVIGSPIANRMRIEVEPLMGFFVNTLAMRATIDPGQTFSDLLAQVRNMTLSAYTHQDLPFDKLVEELQPERTVSYNPIFQHTFGLHRASMSVLEVPGLQAEEILVDRESVPFDLNVSLTIYPHGLQIEVEYSTDLFDADRMERLIEHYRTLLESVVADQEQKIGQLQLLTPAERQQILVEWNQTEADYPRELCIHQVFEEQVLRKPDSVALVFGDRTVTYQQLNDSGNALAQRLSDEGVEPGEIVGVYVERSIEMVVALLAILKTGAAYLPLDPLLPGERLSFMASDARLRTVLYQTHLPPSPALTTSRSIAVDLTSLQVASERPHDFKNRATSSDLCYVMYTSGSTGNPKGVCVPHTAVVRLVKGANYVNLDAEEVLYQYAPLSFDASTFEIWGALLNGARLVIAPPEVLSLAALGQEIRKHSVTTLFFTTVLFNELVDEQLEDLQNVKQILTGGEVLSFNHMEKAMRGLSHCRLSNIYGPTENTTFSTCHWMQQKDLSLTSIPIGNPISNTRIYILDDHQNPVPIGIPGEIYVGGEGVALGYLNQPERTAEKFIPDPFSPKPQARMYRTGDLGRWNGSGEVEFIGRLDDQVKIRGFRVEPSEIVATLNQHPEVKQNVILPYVDPKGTRHLIAYIVSRKEIPTTEFRKYLENRLPSYMVPSFYYLLPELPSNFNKKLSRNLLPVPDSSDERIKDNYIGPQNYLQSQLVRIWENVLNRSSIGVHDNFFNLGGHSLLALKLFAEIEKQTGINLPLVTLLSAQTIEALADVIRGTAMEWSSLVPIQAAGANPPLFLAHPVGGTVLRYRLLASYLGENQPVYGLQSKGLDGKESFLLSIEEMAELYIREIQTVQPRGPYRLGGYSFGGVIAFEMAQQLQRLGEEVSFLAIFDSVPKRPSKGWIEALSSRLAVNIRELVHQPRHKLSLLRKKFRSVVSNSPEQKTEMTPMMQRFWQVRRVNEKAFAAYKPQFYSGTVHVFVAKDLIKKRDVAAMWREFTQNLIVSEVPGHHGNMTHEPNVQILAQRLKVYLD